MKRMKRMLCLALAVLMTVSMLPVGVFAQGGSDADIAAEQLRQDIESSIADGSLWYGLYEDAEVSSLTLAYHDLQFYGDMDVTLTVQDRLTVQDDCYTEILGGLTLNGDLVVAEGEGTPSSLVLAGYGSYPGNIDNSGRGTLEIKGGMFGGRISCTGMGSVVISGGTFEDEPDESFLAPGCVVSKVNNGYSVDPMCFALNISGAGSSDAGMNMSVSGESESKMEELMSQETVEIRDRVKCRFMQAATELNEETKPSFFLDGLTESRHEIVLYSHAELDPDKLMITGRIGEQPFDGPASDAFAASVFGDGSGALYFYTAKIDVPAEDCILAITYDGEIFEELPFYHVSPTFSAYGQSYVTNLYVTDYTEDPDGLLSAFTLELAGLNLPTDASRYQISISGAIYDPETDIYEDDTETVRVVSVSGPDDCGKLTLSCALPEGYDLWDSFGGWLDLHMDGEETFYFDGPMNCLEDSGETSFPRYSPKEEQWKYGVFVSFCPYYSLSACEPLSQAPVIRVPAVSEKNPVEIAVELRGYAGGTVSYSTDGGTTWSAYETAGTALSLTLPKNGSYTLVFRFRAAELEDYQTKAFKLALAVPDRVPDTLPRVTLPAVTTAKTVTAEIEPSSYEGGQMSWTFDSAAAPALDKAVSSAVSVTLPDEYGEYTVFFHFKKDGITLYQLPVTIEYRDPQKPAPTGVGIEDALTGEAAETSGSAFVLHGDADRVYLFCAQAGAGQTLELMFTDGAGSVLSANTMTYDAEKARYAFSIKRSSIPEQAAIAVFRVKAEEGGMSGHEASVSFLQIKEGFLDSVYVPSLPSAIRKNADGSMFRASAPGAVVSGVFRATADADWSRRAVLVYTDLGGNTKTVTQEAQTDPENPDLCTVGIAIPDDAETLSAMRFELVNPLGIVSNAVSYDLSEYRVYAPVLITGIPASYTGVMLRLTGANYGKTVVLTDALLEECSLGEIATGSYHYEFTGASGYIAGGDVTITRGDTVSFASLPELGSFTASTNRADVAAAVTLTYTSPDGETHQASGAVGTTMKQLPAGASVTAVVTYDASAYPEVRGLDRDTKTTVIDGDTTLSFAFSSFTMTKLSGYLMRGAAGNYRQLNDVYVTVEQTIVRGGKEELFTQTMKTGADSSGYRRGYFMFSVYDGFDVKLTFRGLTVGTHTETVPASELASYLSRSVYIDEAENSVYTVMPRLYIETLRSVDENGKPYFGENDSVRSTADSAQLSFYGAYLSSNYFGKDYFDQYTVAGQTVLKFHDITAAYETDRMTLNYSASLLDPNGAPLNVTSDGPVVFDANGNGTADFTARYRGGEVRATVVDDPDSGNVGFLVVYQKVTDTFQYCYFAQGTGELTVAFPQSMSGAKVMAFMVPEADAGEIAELLRTNSKTLAEMTDSPRQWGTGRYIYEKELPYKDLSLSGGTRVYLDDMKPTESISTELLPPFRFRYSFDLGSSSDTVKMTAVLERRELKNWGNTEWVSLCVVNPVTGETTAPASFTLNGASSSGSMAIRQDFAAGTITAELPLDADNKVRFRLEITDAALSIGTVQEVEIEEALRILDISIPSMVSISDQLRSQKLSEINTTEEQKSRWKLPVSIRATGNKTNLTAESSKVTVWDNGVAIDTFYVSAWNYRRNLRLVDNLKPGVHMIWLTMTNCPVDGELVTVTSQPKALCLMDTFETGAYVSDLTWDHWNHRVSGQECDHMVFANLSDIAGRTIWIWPGKRSRMQFKVNNAVKAELTGVNLVLEDIQTVPCDLTYDSTGAVQWWGTCEVRTDLKTIPAKWVKDEGSSSWWEIDDFDMGYATGFRFDITRGSGYTAAYSDLSYSERHEQDLRDFYKENGLGELYDDLDFVDAIAGATNKQVSDSFNEYSECIPDELTGLDLKVTRDDANGFRVELQTPTEDVTGYTVEMSRSESTSAGELWQWQGEESESGKSTLAGEEGWDVYWMEMDGVPGSTYVRLAVLKETTPDGLIRTAMHRSVYMPQEVVDAFESEVGGNGAVKLMSAGDGLMSATLLGTGVSLREEFEDNLEKTGYQAYSTSSELFTYTDLANTFLDESNTKNLMKMGYSADEAGRIAAKSTWISNGAGTTMNILGVADAVYTYYKGPSGTDGSGLRGLLSHVKDERFRRGIENQIRDYEDMRQAIFEQDMTMKGVSSAAGFAPAGFWTKLAVFIGGKGNDYLSQKAKDYNQQVYNTTLMDIQRQIQFETHKAELQAARDDLKNFLGYSGRYYRSFEEALNDFVLIRTASGKLRYVDKCRAPHYNTYLDPSGYVYEATEENRLDGVSATLYCANSVSGDGTPTDFSVWVDTNADEAMRQENPLVTAEGRYSWMVPSGWWKVAYSAEGYLPAMTTPMYVPPMHTDVNIGLLSAEAPKAAVNVGTDRITVLFTKYMQLESLVRLPGVNDAEGDVSFADTAGASYTDESFDASSFAVRFFDGDGRPVSGTVSFPDRAENTGYKGEGYSTDVIDSDYFARTAVFAPTDITADLSAVSFEFADGMVSYAGVALAGETDGLRLVTFDTAGGTLNRPAQQITEADGSLAGLYEPYREGYTFAGWFTLPEDGEKITADTVFPADTTVYAQWTKVIQVAEGGTAAQTPENELKLTFTVEGTAGTQMIAVAYDEDGRMLDVQTVTLKDPSEDVAMTLDTKGVSDVKWKLMAVDADYRPLMREILTFR